MESQIVSRRVNMIAAHLAAHEDISTAPTHVFPVICSSNLNSVIRRCDNRMHFARQGSSSQGCFMRPSSYEQGNPSAIPPKSIGYANTASNASDTPMFSRPSSVEPSKKSVQQIPYVAQCYKYQYSECSPEAPKFARPCGTTTEESRVQSRPRNYASETKGWSPKMDVAESRLNYMVMVELPGANVSDIKVEVSDQNLMISGNRPTPWKVATYLCDSVSAYHKRDILQGPYQLAWPLPSNVNKDSVSAEFFDGLLRVIIPKLS
nr:putative small heat shock protein [Ipomoea batatas]